jgi:exopolyphosphatase/guanosine-5'-triphosphate,3'-diphosphate pyrophosphatase
MLSSWVCLDEILTLGHAWGFDAEHAALVNRLALRLFDQLQPLHRMGGTERLWLSTAAWLHDIGKAQGTRDHHKRAQKIILGDDSLNLMDENRRMIALLARYHRGDCPLTVPPTRGLNRETRCYLAKLAALLRLADGLDPGAQGIVEDLHCCCQRTQVTLEIMARRSLSLAKFHRKTPLFTEVYGCTPLPRVRVRIPDRNFLLDRSPSPTYAECR